MRAAFVNVAVVKNILGGKTRRICLTDIGAFSGVSTETGIDQDLPFKFRAALIAGLIGESLVDVGVTEAEIQGLAQGKLILGEITGVSDGLVFLSSATLSRCRSKFVRW